jgi:hypothetical protein
MQYITVLCVVTQHTMSDMVALAQEIAKWQKTLEEHEADVLRFQDAFYASQRQKYECERVIFDLKDRLCALCKNGQSKSPEPPLRQHTVLLDANGARQFDRENTIAYDAINRMQEAGASQASHDTVGRPIRCHVKLFVFGHHQAPSTGPDSKKIWFRV